MNSQYTRTLGFLLHARNGYYILNLMVQYTRTGFDTSFAALSDVTRRGVLEQLGRADASITDLAEKFHMTLTGMKKHVGVLEQAGLIVTRRSGREKLHFLNPVPIRLIHDRWIDKYTERQVAALADLKAGLEAKTWRKTKGKRRA